MPATQDNATKQRARQARRGRIYGLAKRALVIVAILAAGAALWLNNIPQRAVYAVREGYYHSTANDGFAVRNLLVTGRVNTDPVELRHVLDVDRGTPMLAFDPSEAARALRRLPWVQTAVVERRLPDTIYVHLTERQPAALWQSKGKLRVIDATGVELTDQNLAKFASLPLVVGADAPTHAAAFLRLLSDFPVVAGQVAAASWVAERRWDVKLKNGIILQLPAEDDAAALDRLSTTEGKAALTDPLVTGIDLREQGSIAVRRKAAPASLSPPAQKQI